MRIISILSLIVSSVYFCHGAPAGGNDGHKQIVCYYSSWSGYRPDVGTFTIDDIPVHLCTHLIYAFIGLNNRTWELLVLDPPNDITKGGYRRFTSLKKKNPNLKTLISVGGWVEGGHKYSEMASKPERRKVFVNSVVDFIKWFNFDGLDLDWEFPGSTDRDGRSEDKENFVQLVKELRDAFDKEGWGWLLTAVVPIMKFRVESGYDVGKLTSMLDHIHLLTYDLRGNWTGFSDIHTPLRPREFDLGDYEAVNMHDGAMLWEQLGTPLHKITIGLALYGRTYTLADPAVNGLHSRLNFQRTAGNPGPYTKANGTLAYYEICEMQREGGWDIRYDDVGDSPYMVKGDQWIGYDDRHSLVQKVKFIQEKNYGGVAVWSVDLDDFRGACGEPRILLNAVYKQITGRSAHSAGLQPNVLAPFATQSPVTTPAFHLHASQGVTLQAEESFSSPVPDLQTELAPRHPSQDLDSQTIQADLDRTPIVNLGVQSIITKVPNVSFQPPSHHNHQTLSHTSSTSPNPSLMPDLIDELQGFYTQTPPSLSLASTDIPFFATTRDYFRITTATPPNIKHPEIVPLTTEIPANDILPITTEMDFSRVETRSQSSFQELPSAEIITSERSSNFDEKILATMSLTTEPSMNIQLNLTTEANSTAAGDYNPTTELPNIHHQSDDIISSNISGQFTESPESFFTTESHILDSEQAIPRKSTDTKTLPQMNVSATLAVHPDILESDESLPPLFQPINTSPPPPPPPPPPPELSSDPHNDHFVEEAVPFQEIEFTESSFVETTPPIPTVVGALGDFSDSSIEFGRPHGHIHYDGDDQKDLQDGDFNREFHYDDDFLDITEFPATTTTTPIPTTTTTPSTTTTTTPTTSKPSPISLTPPRRRPFNRRRPAQRTTSSSQDALTQRQTSTSSQTRTTSARVARPTGSRRVFTRRRPTTVPTTTTELRETTDIPVITRTTTRRQFRATRRPLHQQSQETGRTSPRRQLETTTSAGEFYRLDTTPGFEELTTATATTVRSSGSNKRILPGRRLRIRTRPTTTPVFDTTTITTRPPVIRVRPSSTTTPKNVDSEDELLILHSTTEYIQRLPNRPRRPQGGTAGVNRVQGSGLRRRQRVNVRRRLPVSTVSTDTEFAAEEGNHEEVFVRFQSTTASPVVDYVSGGLKATRSVANQGHVNQHFGSHFRAGRKYPSQTPNESIPPNQAPHCEGSQTFYSHFLCDKYWTCIHGSAVAKQCEMGLLWNPQTSSCDWATNVQRYDCE